MRRGGRGAGLKSDGAQDARRPVGPQNAERVVNMYERARGWAAFALLIGYWNHAYGATMTGEIEVGSRVTVTLDKPPPKSGLQVHGFGHATDPLHAPMRSMNSGYLGLIAGCAAGEAAGGTKIPTMWGGSVVGVGYDGRGHGFSFGRSWAIDVPRDTPWVAVQGEVDVTAAQRLYGNVIDIWPVSNQVVASIQVQASVCHLQVQPQWGTYQNYSVTTNPMREGLTVSQAEGCTVHAADAHFDLMPGETTQTMIASTVQCKSGSMLQVSAAGTGPNGSIEFDGREGVAGHVTVQGRDTTQDGPAPVAIEPGVAVNLVLMVSVSAAKEAGGGQRSGSVIVTVSPA
ncbi:hypothetical protein HNP29_004020 [Pseudomonas alcaligenes]|nr:hypothetical protein [Pseudomonas alcaligenes]